MGFREITKPKQAYLKLIENSKLSSALHKEASRLYDQMHLGSIYEVLKSYEFTRYSILQKIPIVIDVTVEATGHDKMQECPDSPVGVCVYERHSNTFFSYCLCCRKSWGDRNKLNKRIKDETS
jgi:hypothetical protein